MLCGRLEKVSKEWIRCQWKNKIGSKVQCDWKSHTEESFLLKHPRRLNEHANAMRAGLKTADRLRCGVFWTWCKTVLSPSTKTEVKESHLVVSRFKRNPWKNIRKLGHIARR